MEPNESSTADDAAGEEEKKKKKQKKPIFCGFFRLWMVSVVPWRDGGCGDRYIPEAVGRVVDRSRKPPLGRKVSCQWRQSFHIVTRVVSKLDSDGICCTFWYSIVEVLDSTFSFHALVESNETHSFWQTCRTKKKSNIILLFMNI